MGKDKGKTGPLSRRPDNSAFKQQRLPAWSPMLTANTVLPFFYFASLLCLVLGAVLIDTVKRTQEIKVGDSQLSVGKTKWFFLIKTVSLNGCLIAAEGNKS